jgi:hypothetical protein
MATTKEIKNWEWIKSVEVQYMGFLTQYLGTATDSNGLVELMKQLRLDEAIAYLKDDLGKGSSEPSYYKFQFYTKTMQFTKKEEFWEAISKGSMPEIEQLEGKELLDTLEALRSISPPNSKSITRILYNRYGNAHTGNYLLLIDREIQTRNCLAQ